MQPGELVAERFALEARVGAGGMGQVYRAIDRCTGDLVAIKMLLVDSAMNTGRFTLEARALAELSDPHIVRYVAHGVTGAGQPYLAMEWLAGDHLGARLKRGPLTVAEGVELARRVAAGLGAAHERGIVHRDLKPSNIFLVDGRVDGTKLLDFGIARFAGASGLTRTGAFVGTPGYMAPEQARNDHTLDARADLFSLGCVLFECLTGEAPFVAEHPMALLAKMIFAEPRRPRELRPELPEALERLILRMLAKEPDERPRDVSVVLAELATIESTTAAPAPALTRSERRLSSVILIGGSADRSKATLAGTLGPDEADAAAALRSVAEAWGGRSWSLPGGALAVSFASVGMATDQARRAARCALALRAHAEGRALALASGRGDVTGGSATQVAIDRAVSLLAARSDGAVALDETTAHLLDGRFDAREDEHGLALHGERDTTEGARLLLGQLTPCVGRERELSTLVQLFAECVEEPRAQAALVTGPAGIGKSRVAQEFLARVRQRGEPLTVWIGRGDPLRAGSPFGLLGQALRGALAVHGDEACRRPPPWCTRLP